MSDIVVIGAAGGVGLALTRMLVERGEKVVACVLDATEQQRLEAAVPGCVAIHHLDLGDADIVKDRLASILNDRQSVRAVALCAATAPCAPVEVADLASIRRVLEVNLVSHIAIYQSAMPALRKTRGRLVMISSIAGRVALPFIGVYTATKQGLEGLADTMRREAGPQGVDIVIVQPGGIRTQMVVNQAAALDGDLAALDDDQRERYGYLYEGFKRVIEAGQASASPPEHIAEVILEALDAERPNSRYVAGEDARQLLDMVAQKSDAELDAILPAMFAAP